ncbi:MAG: hypothetical protein RLZZ621_1145 [Gemmatimonadota bacterium]
MAEGTGPLADFRPVRLAALREALGRADLDGMLVTAPANVRYLTGFSGSSALVLVTALEVWLWTDFRYATQVEEEVGGAATVRIEPANLWTGLWTALAGMPSIGRIGFESAHLLHRDFARLLEQGARWQWRPTVDLIETLRATKDAGEIDAIRRAVAMAEVALEQTLASLRPGITEQQVAGMLEGHLREVGSEAFPFPTIVASGPRSALPHARASERRLAPGDLVLIDFGAVADGYCSDITRTVVLGAAASWQREIYAIVLEANRRASGAVRVGMTGKAADAVARDYIDECGFGEAFGHSLGHGIGLDVHEAPRLARSIDASLGPDMVVTIEPGIYRPGLGGVRIEDDVRISAEGGERLTHFRRELLEL